MRKRWVLYTVPARDDLTNIGRWLARNASEAVARRFVGRIRLAIRELQYASERGTVREGGRGIRIIGILPTVGVAFSVDEDAVHVHRILHNGQNWLPGD